MTNLAAAPELDRELAYATYRKSSFSGAGNDCVELAVRPTVTGIRDTKRRAAGRLTLPDAARAALVAFARADGGEETGTGAGGRA